MTYTIEVRLSRQQLKPTNVSATDVAELIRSVEQAIAALVVRDNPKKKLSEDDVIVGLLTVNLNSYAPVLVVDRYEEEVSRAVGEVVSAINTQDYELLPSKTVETLKAVKRIGRKHNSDVEFWELNGERKRLATIKPDTKIEVITTFIEGRTTLYGYVLGISGDNPPYLRLRMLGGQTINCNVTAGEGLRVARVLGQRLYTDVGVRGIGRWDVSDMTLTYFLVEDITPYEKTSLTKALDALHEITADDYRQVSDINELVADLRGRGDGEE